MKKFLKGCLSLALMFVVVFSFTACKTKLSDTTVDTSKVKSSNGVSTNGGMTVVHGNYLYFINGTKTNDGTNLEDNTRSAIYRVKYDIKSGEINKKSYERVVSNLAGFEKGSLYIFGDFLYYAVPCTDENYKGDILYNKLTFMRYDLVNKKSYELYTTNQNTSGDISYAYYIVGDSLNLVVYEKIDASITSVKINKKVTTNYVIKDVTSCTFSENNGRSLKSGKTDANNFVYYTVGHEQGEPVQTGVKVYRTSPVKNNSKLLSDDGKEVTVLCVRNGKLIYTVGNVVYFANITGSNSDKLSFEFSNVLTYSSSENVIFMENEDGSISLLTYNKTTYALVVTKWIDGVEIMHHEVNILSGTKDDKFSFVGLTTLTEEIEYEEENPESGEMETKTRNEKAQYLIYINNSTIYKIEIAREDEHGEMKLSKYTQPITLSTSDVEAPTGLLMPEVIGNNLFVLAKDKDKNIHMHVIDISVTENSTENATMVGVAEEEKEEKK